MWAHSEEKVPESRLWDPRGMKLCGVGVDMALVPLWVFSQGKIYHYSFLVPYPQVTFLLEFEFSCTFLLGQVLVRLTASR